MTDHEHPDVPDLELVELEPADGVVDRRLRAAARGLRDHIGTGLDPATAAHHLPPARRSPSWARAAAVLAVVALAAGGLALAMGGDDGERVAVDHEVDLDPRPLTLLGPRDGKDSMQLPVTASPDRGVVDGDIVTVTGSGFAPGETVGIVQCAVEARDLRAGVDACDIARPTPVTADADGVATGTFRVSRILTTPLTGTIDCASSERRCGLGVGAISDYDRAGGVWIQFAPGDPVEIPSSSVTPSTDLTDGQVVEVDVRGLPPRTTIWVEQCSVDPSVCADTMLRVGDPPTAAQSGMEVDGGQAHLKVRVWRFLPAGSDQYADCAISRCVLRFVGLDKVPAPAALAFRGDEPPPTAPTLEITPATDLRDGQEVHVLGAGFRPGEIVVVEVCLTDAAAAALHGTEMTAPFACVPLLPESLFADDDGDLSARVTLRRLSEFVGSQVQICTDDGTCTVLDAEDISCGVTLICVASAAPLGVPGVDAAGERPSFGSAPITITYRAADEASDGAADGVLEAGDRITGG